MLDQCADTIRRGPGLFASAGEKSDAVIRGAFANTVADDWAMAAIVVNPVYGDGVYPCQGTGRHT